MITPCPVIFNTFFDFFKHIHQVTTTLDHVEPHFCLGFLGSPGGNGTAAPSLVLSRVLCSVLRADLFSSFYFFFSTSTKIFLQVRLFPLSVWLIGRPSVLCGASLWYPSLCQALGFLTSTMGFHSRGFRSQELNPKELSS